MQVLLNRRWKKDDYTIGEWIVDGRKMCNTLEDTDRELRQDMNIGEIEQRKVYGKTAIPTGQYKIMMTYSPKYMRIMPQVMNVKGFTGIRVHSGNTADDSLGCILLGDNDRKGWVSNSRQRCAEFEKLLEQAGGSCDLEIM